MRSRKNILLLVVCAAVLAAFIQWIGPTAAAQGQYSLTGQSTESPNWKTWRVVTSPSPGSNLNVLNSVAGVPGTENVWAVGDTLTRPATAGTLWLSIIARTRSFVLKRFESSMMAVVTLPMQDG